MKNYKKLFLTNNIIIGLSAIAFLLYEYFIGLAIVATSVSENIYEEATTIQNIAKYIGLDGLIAIVLYVIFIILNHIFMKKENKKGILAITIIASIILVIYIVKNILIF